MNNIEFLREVFKKYNLTEDDYHKNAKFVIITRPGIEKIQQAEKIHIRYKVELAQKDCVMLKAKGWKEDGQPIYTFASASSDNCQSKHYLEVAEKRALSRIVLKLVQIYQHGVFGEDENLETDNPADTWQIKLIDKLLRSSVLPEEERERISDSYGFMTFDKATLLIKSLKDNQQNSVQDGNYTVTEAGEYLDKILKDEKK
jgi:hypothetical protein